MKVVVIAFLAITCLVFVGAGQDQLCSRCGTTGKVKSKTPEDPLEHDVLFCSMRLKRDPTLGLGWAPCEKCKSRSLTEAAGQEFDANASKVKAWQTQQDKIAKDLSSELETIETEHFILTWGLGAFTGEDKRAYDQHSGMHLFASR